MSHQTSAPLDGIRVIDFTSMIAGPTCTRLLADCGAEVIKIEPPSGDHMRRTPPQRNGHSSYFGQMNCGKKSVVLDLKSPAGKDRIRRLIATADVVVENYRPGVMASLELDYPALSLNQTDLIYCSISGYGQNGPRAQHAAYAPIIHASSGYDQAQHSYQEELDAPERCGIFTADVLVGVYAFSAVQTALIGKLRHGTGQYIDVAMLDSMISLLVFECQLAQFPQDTPRNLFGPVRSKDGYVVVTTVTQKNFVELAEAIDRDDWLDDPRFNSVEGRRTHWRLFHDEIEKWTQQRTAEQCEEILVAAGIPCTQYRSLQQAMVDPQTVERGVFQTVEDVSGRFLVPNPPFQFADNSVHARSRSPQLGEHTDEILAEIA